MERDEKNKIFKIFEFLEKIEKEIDSIHFRLEAVEKKLNGKLRINQKL